MSQPGSLSEGGKSIRGRRDGVVMSQGIQPPPEAGRGKEGSFLRTSTKNQHCQHLDFIPISLPLEFWPLEVQVNKLLVF